MTVTRAPGQVFIVWTVECICCKYLCLISNFSCIFEVMPSCLSSYKSLEDSEFWLISSLLPAPSPPLSYRNILQRMAIFLYAFNFYPVNRDLNGQYLQGVLSPELGNLTHLRFLWVSTSFWAFYIIISQLSTNYHFQHWGSMILPNFWSIN